MYDASIYYSGRSSKLDNRLGQMPNQFENKKFVLATVHREENTDQREQLEQIVDAFRKISEIKPIVWPVHPRTRKMLLQHNLEDRLQKDTIFMMDPVGYLEMLELLNRCCLVMTDSGGVQKEAYFFKKPCVTLRNETEWVELVDHGFNTIVGTKTDLIVNSAKSFLEAKIDFSVRLYGSGDAGYKIATILSSVFS
jgi:UDP-GlcNAc3NAcA epimerase